MPDASLVAGVESYGFKVSAGGVGSTYFNIGDSGEAFDGYDDYDDVLVIDLLLATDRKTTDGLLYDVDGNGQIDHLEAMLRTLANEVYSAINERGAI